MSSVIKAILSMAVAVAAVVAMGLVAGTIAIVVGGPVVVVAILVFARAVIPFAAEPGEKSRRRGRVDELLCATTRPGRRWPNRRG